MQGRHRAGFTGKSYISEPAEGHTVSWALNVQWGACRPQTPPVESSGTERGQGALTRLCNNRGFLGGMTLRKKQQLELTRLMAAGSLTPYFCLPNVEATESHWSHSAGKRFSSCHLENKIYWRYSSQWDGQGGCVMVPWSKELLKGGFVGLAMCNIRIRNR